MRQSVARGAVSGKETRLGTQRASSRGRATRTGRVRRVADLLSEVSRVLLVASATSERRVPTAQSEHRLVEGARGGPERRARLGGRNEQLLHHLISGRRPYSAIRDVMTSRPRRARGLG